MAVCAGLTDESKWDRIARIIGTDGSCSPYFERWVMEALFMMNRQEQALLRMYKRYRPMINAGFTTLWEYMNRAPLGGAGTDGIDYLTLNHAWNTPNTILSKFAAGVAPDSPGWTDYHVLPKEAFLKSLRVVVPTVKGEIAMEIRIGRTSCILRRRAGNRHVA